jgi:hypothetical protein
MDPAQETFEDYYDYPNQDEPLSGLDAVSSDGLHVDGLSYGHPTYDGTRHFILFHFNSHTNT